MSSSMWDRARGGAPGADLASWHEPTPVLRARTRRRALPWLIALLATSVAAAVTGTWLDGREVARGRAREADWQLAELRRTRGRLERGFLERGDRLDAERAAAGQQKAAGDQAARAASEALAAALKEPLEPERVAIAPGANGEALVIVAAEALFGEGATLSLDGMRLLHRAAKAVQAAPGRRVRIEARFDPSLPSPKPHGAAATAAQATAVLAFLRDDAGLDGSSLALALSPEAAAPPPKHRGKGKKPPAAKPTIELVVSGPATGPTASAPAP